MKSNSLVNPRIAAFTVCGIGLALGLFASHARADLWDKKTVLTVNETIQVRDKVLQPGQYVFKLLNSSSDRHIVQIFNGDQSKIIDTVLAIPAYRQTPTGDSQFTFWETPPGTAKALRTWYYPGDNYGQEFTYPKQLAMLETPPAPPTASANPTPEPPPAPTPSASVAEPPAEPVPPTPTPSDEKAAAEMDQQPQTPATPTPTPAEPQTPATPTPSSSADRSAELPQTSSPYPTIGAIGLLSLAAFGALRLKRQVKH